MFMKIYLSQKAAGEDCLKYPLIQHNNQINTDHKHA